MHGFHVGQELDNQSSSLYRFPIGDASSDILRNIDDCISSPLNRMLSEKVSKLLSYPGVHSR